MEPVVLGAAVFHQVLLVTMMNVHVMLLRLPMEVERSVLKRNNRNRLYRPTVTSLLSSDQPGFSIDDDEYYNELNVWCVSYL